MKRQIYQRNADAGTDGGVVIADSGEKKEAGFGLLSELEMDIDPAAQTTPPATDDSKKTADEIAGDNVEDDSGEEGEFDLPSDVSTKKGKGETKEKLEEGDSVDSDEEDSFVLPGEEADGGETELTWKGLAQKQGFDVKDDSYEAYEEARKTAEQTRIDAAIKEAVSKAQKVELDKFDPEAQELISYLNNKGTLEAFLEPLKPINELKALGDADLVARDLAGQGWDDEMIETEIARMIENETLAHEAKKVRVVVNQMERQTRESIIQKQQQLADKRIAEVAEIKKKESESISTALNKRADFLSIKLQDKHKTYLQQNWESGKYKELFNDPQAVVDFMLFTEFGKQAEKKLVGQGIVTGKNKVRAKLSNSPIQKQGVTRGAAASGKKSEGFEILSDLE